jgi:hypothetical protein
MTQPSGSDYLEVASAYAAPSAAADDAVTVTVNGAFPYEFLSADCIIHCTGSVPVIVTYEFDEANCDPMLIWLWNEGYASFQACEFDIITTTPWDVSFGPAIGEWIQMHYCDYAKFWLFLDLPQNEDLEGLTYPGTDRQLTQADFMGKTWTFTAYFNAIQWNESDVFASP